MATPPLIEARLPREPELQSFARATAHLLIEQHPRVPGARAVTRRAGTGLQHLDHRDYAPGDEIRHIDWRLTARTRRPIVRRFEAESVSDWTVLVDASSSMAADGGAKWKAAVCAAAAMSYALLQVGHRVGLIAFGARVLAECPRGRGRHHYAEIARLLTALQPAGRGEGSELGACAPHLHGSGSVFALSDFLADDEMRRDLALLRECSAAVHAVQLRDDAETRLPQAGEFDLVDVETGTRLVTRADASANAQAASVRGTMTRRLRSFCARGGIAFTDWDVARAWRLALLGHLLRARSSC